MAEVKLYVVESEPLPEGWRLALPRIASRYRLRATESSSRQTRNEAYCTGLLLARVLGAVCDEQLTFGPAGKPALAAGTPCFSVSHGGGLVALAVSDADVGADVERIPAAYGPAQRAAARRILPAERFAALDAAPASDAPRLFALAWTRTEAVLKAAGSGFGVDPREHPEALEGWEVESVEHRGCVLTVARRDPFEIDLVAVDAGALAGSWNEGRGRRADGECDGKGPDGCEDC